MHGCVEGGSWEDVVCVGVERRVMGGCRGVHCVCVGVQRWGHGRMQGVHCECVVGCS